jgi:hypothetical protein
LCAGEQELPGLTDEEKPRQRGPKRASKIRKLFNLTKDDDVRHYVKIYGKRVEKVGALGGGQGSRCAGSGEWEQGVAAGDGCCGRRDGLIVGVLAARQHERQRVGAWLERGHADSFVVRGSMAVGLRSPTAVVSGR